MNCVETGKCVIARPGTVGVGTVGVVPLVYIFPQHLDLFAHQVLR